ncbi:hypothetical protein GQ55_5G172000 [Panicum hallii var. hallii]|uniref:F-box/LRR-repeat protein 15/At3g58940/PEG3-like LRR domain-containing protein n=1 Tax=Panicum hallii var. hallii TaxID=1504633 RepID=A0A2T7DH92_9POAL|nr:hypothetical protein GQ55_5G172000 [Panicum hallii var. hallii]
MAADVGTDLPCDRLSDLPDAILVFILSLLRLDEVARCTVLAPRWRRLFSSTLLLDFNANMPGRLDIIGTVNSILAAHPTAPVRSFRASWRFIPRDKNLSSGGWLQELARRGVEELSLDFDFHDWHHRIPVSLSTAPQAPPRERLHLPGRPQGGVRRPAPGTPDRDRAGLGRHLRCLRELPALAVHGTGAPEDVWNEQVRPRPCSISKPQDPGQSVKIAQAPKLKFLGYLGMNYHKIEIGETIFTDDPIIVKTLMPSLKTLAIERLIRSDTWSRIQAAASESWDVLRHIPCVHNHLEKVVFEVYRGHEMAKFLHGRSRVLKAMEFHCMRESDGGAKNHTVTKPPSVEWVRKQQELLCLDSRI